MFASHVLPTLSLFVTKVVEAYIFSDFHFIIGIDCHYDKIFNDKAQMNAMTD